MTLDPDLIGIWIIPGAPATYEVVADGTYHVADPEAPLSFEQSGMVMIWGAQRLMRLEGSGETPEGRWHDEDTGDDWLFLRDGSYEITVDGVVDTGIWALRDNGAALWTRELRARIDSNGAEVTFHPVGGGSFTYGYMVENGVWTLLDPETWKEVARYISPAQLAASA